MNRKKTFFGRQFKKIMLDKDISQKELADRLGIAKAMITNWISGVRNPSLNSLKKIAEELNVPLNYFIEENNNDQKNGKNKNEDNTIDGLDKKDIKILKLENENFKLRQKLSEKNEIILKLKKRLE